MERGQNYEEKLRAGLAFVAMYAALDTPQGTPFDVLKVAPGWHSPPNDLQLYTGKTTGVRPARKALWNCSYLLLWW